MINAHILLIKCNETLRESSTHLSVLVKSIRHNRKIIHESESAIAESRKSLRFASGALKELDYLRNANEEIVACNGKISIE